MVTLFFFLLFIYFLIFGFLLVIWILHFFFGEIGIEELILRFTSLAGYVSVLFVVLLEVFGAFI